MNWEFEVLDFIQKNFLSDVMTVSMKAVSYASTVGIIWIIGAVILLFNKKTRHIGIVLGIAMVCNVVIVNLIIKHLVQRVRPFEINLMANVLVNKPKDFSFPSGHTSVGFAFSSVLFIFKQKKMFIFALILATITGFSRLYLYVHYPTDVIFGAIFGVISGIIAYWIYEQFLKDKICINN